MRWLLIIALSAAAVALVLAYRPPLQPGAPAKKIQLSNLPVGYCPSRVWLIVTDHAGKVFFDNERTVGNCREVDLTDITLPSEGLVYLKAPLALALKRTFTSESLPLITALALGDVTADNVINGADEVLVRGAVSGSEPVPGTDIDQDGQMTVIDLAYIKVNQRAGEPRPDGKPWSEAVH